MNRDELVAKLQSDLLKVTFKKVNGAIRVMECTLVSDFLPMVGHTSTTQSEEVIPVWDLEADAWRSFRVDNVISVEYLDV